MIFGISLKRFRLLIVIACSQKYYIIPEFIIISKEERLRDSAEGSIFFQKFLIANHVRDKIVKRRSRHHDVHHKHPYILLALKCLENSILRMHGYILDILRNLMHTF